MRRGAVAVLAARLARLHQQLPQPGHLHHLQRRVPPSLPAHPAAPTVRVPRRPGALGQPRRRRRRRRRSDAHGAQRGRTLVAQRQQHVARRRPVNTECSSLQLASLTRKLLTVPYGITPCTSNALNIRRDRHCNHCFIYHTCDPSRKGVY